MLLLSVNFLAYATDLRLCLLDIFTAFLLITFYFSSLLVTLKTQIPVAEELVKSKFLC